MKRTIISTVPSAKFIFAITGLWAVSLTSGLAGDFLVQSAALHSVREAYEGPCPGLVEFEGTITAIGNGTVTYSLYFSEGFSSRTQTVVFASGGTQRIHYAINVGDRQTRSRRPLSASAIIKTLAPNEVVSAPAVYRVNCVPESPASPSDVDNGSGDHRPAAAPTAGRFRVTIKGFVCHQATFDDERQTDGVDDEIFVQADMQLYDISGHIRGVRSAVSAIIGDTNGFPGRIRGGSGHSVFGGNGGFHENDTFPAGGRPWERHSEPTTDRPPLFVWEGELRQSKNALLIIPSIWEWDGDVSLEANHYIAALASVWSNQEIKERMTRAISTRATGSGARLTLRGTQFRGLFNEVRVSTRFPGDPKNRPIGMIERAGDYYVFMPQNLVLTYDEASRVAGRNIEGYGPGVYALQFRDHDQLRGLYGLYLQVERLP